MFTFANFPKLLLNYRNANASTSFDERLVPSMLLGARKGKRAASVFKALERDLKTPNDPRKQANEFWENYFKSHASMSAMSFMAQKWEWKPSQKAAVQDLMQKLGEKDGYFWRTEGNASVDLSQWRCFSIAMRTLITVYEFQWRDYSNWELFRSQMELALDEFEKLETMCAMIFSNSDRHMLKEASAFLQSHPLGATTSGKEFIEAVRRGNEKPNQVERTRVATLGWRLAMTGALWQLAILDLFLTSSDSRTLWPLRFPDPSGSVVRSASSQWIEQLKEFVEQGPLFSLGEWPRKKGRGRPSKTEHIAEFLWSHFEDGRGHKRLKEKLADILNGKAELTFRLVEEIRSDLLASIEQRCDAACLKHFTEQVNCLTLNGHVAGFVDYMGRVGEHTGGAEALQSLNGVFSAVWADWPDIEREAVDFLRLKRELS